MSDLSESFLNNGYIVSSVNCEHSLDSIVQLTCASLSRSLGSSYKVTPDNLDFLHTLVDATEVNKIRSSTILDLNASPSISEVYFRAGQASLRSLLGPDIAEQRNLNLSIQLPGDADSLLTMHADTWSGDSPYEVVMWIPLTDCFNTKSMYILPAWRYNEYKEIHAANRDLSALEIFQTVKDWMKFLNVKRGQFVIFNQCLPHGNVVNTEYETRVSLNCRYKSLFTPYGAKALGPFFRIRSISPVSRFALDYELPIHEDP